MQDDLYAGAPGDGGWSDDWGFDYEGYSGEGDAAALPLTGLGRALEGLTESQLAGVMAPDVPLLLLSGAGTGKTKTVTLRIAQRLQARDLHAANVLALTFTKKAAAEMQRRLEALVGAQAKAMDIGTFHSVFAKALRQCDGEGGVPPDFTLLDDADQQSMLKEAAASISPGYLEEFKRQCKMRDVLAAFAAYSNSLCPGEEPFANPTNIPGFMPLLRAYARLKKSNQVLDYDDVLVEFDRILDVPRIRRMFQQRWRMVCVDEYQDENPLQESIIRKIAGRHRNLTCVGDNDQSIYGWRGAKVSYILDFRRRWPEAEVIALQENFRSRSPILACANSLIKNNTRRHEKVLLPTRGDGAPVGLRRYKDAFEEARAVSAAIAREARAGRRASEIAVIARTGNALGEIQRQLLTDGIPYAMHAGSNIADKIETKLIAAWIRCAVNPRDEAAFLYAFNDHPRGVGKKGLAVARETARQSDATIEAVLRQEHQSSRDAAASKLMRFLDDVTEIRTLARLGEDPAAIVEEIIERSGIRDKIAKERAKAQETEARDERERLEATAAARDENLSLLIEHATQVANLADLAANIILSNESVSDHGDAVWLGTIHASKALEFEIVFLPAFERGILPSPRQEDDGSIGYEEERNLAYVGLTRAKDQLEVSYAMHRTQHGRDAAGGPSAFVPELGVPMG